MSSWPRRIGVRSLLPPHISKTYSVGCFAHSLGMAFQQRLPINNELRRTTSASVASRVGRAGMAYLVRFHAGLCVQGRAMEWSFPVGLGGHRALEKTGACTFREGDRIQTSFSALAIARHDGASTCYLFLCDEQWESRCGASGRGDQLRLMCRRVARCHVGGGDGCGDSWQPAIVVRIRPDISWQTTVCVHDRYGRNFDNTPDDSFEPYAECSYLSPDCEHEAVECEAAAQYLENSPLNGGTGPNYAAIYLIARSVAAFGRIEHQLRIPRRVYFSLMYAVFRFR